jgi:hypothetical protein
MSQSKIEFRLGAMHFIGEGDKEWVTKQLDKIISQTPSLLRVAGDSNEETWSSPVPLPAGKSSTPSTSTRKKGQWKKSGSPAPKVTAVKSTASAKELGAFIKAKNASSNQRAKFLAAALWLSKHGKSNPVTRDITNALKAAKVRALINPSQYLNQNVKQGYLRKSGDGFIVTKKGEAAL